jgi:bacterioferritin-associated ferredoxin
MVVCVCRGVTDAELLSAIRRGACTVESVARRCDGAGRDCGTCQAEIEAYLEHARERQVA